MLVYPEVKGTTQESTPVEPDDGAPAFLVHWVGYFSPGDNDLTDRTNFIYQLLNYDAASRTFIPLTNEERDMAVVSASFGYSSRIYKFVMEFDPTYFAAGFINNSDDFSVWNW